MKRFGYDHEDTPGDCLRVFWLRLFGRVLSVHFELEERA